MHKPNRAPDMHFTEFLPDFEVKIWDNEGVVAHHDLNNPEIVEKWSQDRIAFTKEKLIVILFRRNIVKAINEAT